MAYRLTTLASLIEESLHPGNPGSSIASGDGSVELGATVISEIRLLKHDILLEAELSDKEWHHLLGQLVKLSDTVYHYFHGLSAIRGTKQNNIVLGNLYKIVLNHLENLIDELRNNNRVVGDDISVTKYALPSHYQFLQGRLNAVRSWLEMSDADPELKELLLQALKFVLRGKPLTPYLLTYLKMLMSHIIKANDLNTINLKILLYKYDFNFPDLFIYWINGWQKKLIALPGLHEQLEYLVHQVDFLNDKAIVKEWHLFKEEEPLRIELKNYLIEKIEIITQLLKLRRITIKDREFSIASSRQQMNLSVPLFALFIRLQIEKGLLKKENVGDLFGFFATHFYTAQTTFISAESLQKKSTDIEFATAKKMKGNLIEMLNWLNENFNTNES